MGGDQIHNQIGRDFRGNLIGGNAEGEITLNYTNSNPKLPEFDPSEIQKSITQLKNTIQADSNLTEDAKTIALRQVKLVEEAITNPNKSNRQDDVKTATFTLKGIISSIPTATKLVEEVNNFLPLVSNLLGISLG